MSKAARPAPSPPSQPSTIPTPRALRLRPSNEIVVAGAASERGSVAIVSRIKPKPVAPNSNHHAVVVIVVTPHGVALSEGPEIFRIAIRTSDFHYAISGFVPVQRLIKPLDQALGSRVPARLLVGPRTYRSRCGAIARLLVGPRIYRSRCGAIPSAPTGCGKGAHGLGYNEVDEEPGQFGQNC
jgi:hypothetical protein